MRTTFLGICLLAVLALGVCGDARAAVTFGFAPSGGGVGDALYRADTVTFDWAPDNALAVGGNTAVENFLLNLGDGGARPTTFSTFAQTRVSAITDSVGNSITLPAGWEYTFVARLNETVIGVSPGAVAGDGTAYFGLAGGDNYIEIFADNYAGGGGTAQASPIAGTGYNDGTRILAANVSSIFSGSSFTTSTAVDDLDNFVNNDYPALDTREGSGSITLDAVVNFAHTSYFPTFTAPVVLTLVMNFPTNLVIPFNQVDPAERFLVGTTTTGVAGVPTLAGAGAPGHATWGIGTINADPTTGSGGPSVQEQFDSSQTFDLVPEPASLAIWGLLLIPGVGTAIRRRRRARLA